ncbi:MAG: hypothetical protein KUG81_02340 [Gammaproteobacteria bacterium]|nr:hypothetical protein [Gammaproteobacteria bacterium]
MYSAGGGGEWEWEGRIGDGHGGWPTGRGLCLGPLLRIGVGEPQGRNASTGEFERAAGEDTGG